MAKITSNQRPIRALIAIGLTLIPVVYLQAINMLTGTPVAWQSIALRWSFVLGILVVSWFIQWGYQKSIRYYPFYIILIGIISVISMLMDLTLTAWLAVMVLYGVLIGLDSILTVGFRNPQKLAIHWILAVWAGCFPIALYQIISDFADEEFYALLSAVVMSLLWIIISWVNKILNSNNLPAVSRTGDGYNFVHILIVLLIISFGGMIGTLQAYQQSFYPAVAPTYTGINPQSPYLCGEVLPDPETYQGKDVYYNLIKLVQANPNKESPEYAFLALGTKNEKWAIQFRESILSEARQGLFTLPANSVKSIQYEASRRVYFYSQVIEAFPDLFTPQEDDLLKGWFAALNRRAQTVEWVDWLYALAFSKFPQGPYENQEIGAGLMAILETSRLADPLMTGKNKNYLENDPRGWIQRFRNTDDAFVYQSAWLSNAFFQSLFFGIPPEERIIQSFDWLLLQALPDGAPLGYNHPHRLPPANPAYLGAMLTGKTDYLWLTGRSADYLLTNSGFLSAYPGLTASLDLAGHSPNQGSCLFFGDSGLPNQVGPLAPDKIVFRNGWSPDSIYLLLNLRFTGWHRYKASNTIHLVYQDGPIVEDQTQGQTGSWLPLGRRLFRDKRIPRENLNGLSIEKTGLGNVIYKITSIGSRWAQDPPYYAQVESFETSLDVDTSQTLLKDWHGWQHRRTINFSHQGPIVIVDVTKGPKNHEAAIFWHLPEFLSWESNRVTIRGGDHPIEMVLIPFESDFSQNSLGFQQDNNEGLEVKYNSSSGSMSLATIILTHNWIGADAQIVESSSGPVIKLAKNNPPLIYYINLRDDSRK